MRDLQVYATEIQRSAATARHHALPDSIVRIAKQFSIDMDALRDLLPGDMSVKSKIKIVLKRTETGRVLQRLEERKHSATLALQIIGR